jgi:hypothetical protein
VPVTHKYGGWIRQILRIGLLIFLPNLTKGLLNFTKVL